MFVITNGINICDEYTDMMEKFNYYYYGIHLVLALKVRNCQIWFLRSNLYFVIFRNNGVCFVAEKMKKIDDCIMNFSLFKLMKQDRKEIYIIVKQHILIYSNKFECVWRYVIKMYEFVRLNDSMIDVKQWMN